MSLKLSEELSKFEEVYVHFDKKRKSKFLQKSEGLLRFNEKNLEILT